MMRHAVQQFSALADSSYRTCSLISAVIPQLHQSFQFMPGVCGAAGVFSISLALFIGQYHRKLLQGIALGIAGLVLPYSVTWFWFRITHPSASAGLLQLCGPTAIIAIGTYL